MKILYIVHDNKKGGAAVSFLNMIEGVSKGYDVYVLTPHKKGYIPDELDKLGIWHKDACYFWWEIAKMGNATYDRVRFWLYRALNVYNRIGARRLAKLVEGLGIDIIHSNSSTINIGALVSEITGIPHVWHLREFGDLDFSLAPASKRYSMERVINSGNSFYIAISECIAKYYGKYINDNSKISVIYNGISSSYNYRKSASEYTSDAIKFLISGNYCEEKGQIDVAHAIGLLVSQGVTGFKVYMAGRGDYVEVKEYLQANGLVDYVVFCGLVDDMLALRKKCDVEIVASRTEAFGRVTVEAMRASNPVIGSATGGTTELIQDGVTGFLYEYKDNEVLAERMKRFIDRPALAYEMGQRAYEWSVDRFTSEENVKGVMEVYESLVSKE
ncbi:MAG: glycosyltransferase family 4 protein [Lachnospiraceae bacterium]|nr:glycosyltransferase family 4 protein [Lachnospiraceae bacterium]